MSCSDLLPQFALLRVPRSYSSVAHLHKSKPKLPLGSLTLPLSVLLTHFGGVTPRADG